MLALLSAIVALGCVLASARRLAWVVDATGLEPRMLLEALRAGLGSRALRDRLGQLGPWDWERDLLAACTEPNPAARNAIADEQQLELRWRLRRWERVPRVCASISTSAGFLFASVALLEDLGAPVDGASSPREALFAALTPLALGFAGTAFCVAVHLRARRLVPPRLTAYDELVDAVRQK